MFETLKNTHNLISHQNSRFHCFLMTFSQKTTIETQKWWPFQIILTFLFIHLLPFRRSCYMYETCKNTQIELQHFCSPKKVVPTVFARYNREQLGKYTGKLIVTTDPGIRVWYGMVVYQKDKGMVWYDFPYSCSLCSLLFTRKMAKPEKYKGHHFQHYKHITRLFPYYFPIISLVVHPIDFPIFPLLFPIFSPYYFVEDTYYFPLMVFTLFYGMPYYFPIYNFLILPYYCPICLPGFQNDKLRHLEWLCFDCHAKCLKPAKIHIIWFPTKILDFTVFWWHFPKKRLSKPKNDDPSRLFSLFCSSTCYPFDGHATCMKPAKTHKLNCNTFAAPKKWFQLSLQDIIGNN